jgi:putative ABC transport system permease protein
MFLLKLLFKNAFRHKLRSWLTILSITIAILAFGLLRTVVDAFYVGVERSSANRLVTRNAISMTFGMPLAYKEKIRQVSGVEQVAALSWFGGIYIDEKNFFPNFAVEPKSYLVMYPEYVIPPDQLDTFLKDRKGALAGRKLAERFGWRVGSTITLRGTIYPGNWEFVLRAIYRGRDENVDERLFFFHWDYLNESLKQTAPTRADQVGAYVVEVERSDSAADIAAVIDNAFKNSMAETLTETERSFNLSFISMAEAIIVVIRLVSLAVIIIIIAVAANTMSMTTRERIGEFSILKTLGFGAGRISALILGESLVISMAGCFFGVLLTFPAAEVFRSLLGNYFPVFRVAPETVYLDIAVSALVGGVAAVVPTFRAINIKIADGLRRLG